MDAAVLTVSLPLTALERQVLDEMRVAGGYVSDDDVVLSALWEHALHLNLAPHHDVFRLGVRQASLFDAEAAQ